MIGVGVIGLIALWLRNEEARKGVPKIYYRTKPVSSYNAQTLPPFGIFINADQAKNKALLQHELKQDNYILYREVAYRQTIGLICRRRNL